MSLNQVSFCCHLRYSPYKPLLTSRQGFFLSLEGNLLQKKKNHKLH